MEVVTAFELDRNRLNQINSTLPIETVKAWAEELEPAR